MPLVSARSGRRPGRLLAVLTTVAFAALLPALPAAALHSAAVAAPAPPTTGGGTHGTTITGTVSGDHAWDPKTNKQIAAVPSVTVDQTDNLTDQVVHVTWKNFTPSDDPSGNFFSAGNTFYAVSVLECKGTDPRAPVSYRWPDFGPDCYNFTAADANAAHGVGNQAYTLTGPSGAGETYFHVETAVENDLLGCDENHPCSLVVVPNWGGQQPPGSPPTSSAVNCAAHTGDTSLIFGDYALDNHLGNACSWGDRMVVPLQFAPTPNNCPSKKFAFAAEGAPVLARTFDQWRSAWCNGKSDLTFDFDSGTNEDLARQSFLSGSGALTSATDVAVVNEPAAPGSEQLRKFKYAPLTNSAITIAYHVDDQKTGTLITNLTLDARLVAKLVTQSYSLAFGCTDGGNTHQQSSTCDPAVKGNPVSIFDDKEFLKLNPEYTRADFPSDSLLNRGQFLPIVVSGDSDLTYELTRWIHADPAARAFMAGKPDPWGMHVNTYYKNEPLPTDNFQVLDPGYTAPPSNGVPGQSTMQVTWNPITGMSNVASSLVTDRPTGINPTLPACGVSGVPCVYGRFGVQTPGTRALFAIVGSVDSSADRFPTAKLVNAGGKAVGPTIAGMSSALAHMTTNADGVTQRADFTSKSKSQYPLTTVDYAMVPTCGLSATKVTAIKQFLDLSATSQHTGLLPGDLTPGGVRLTHKQVAQTDAAAAAVSSTSCTPAGHSSSSSSSSSSTSSSPTSQHPTTTPPGTTSNPPPPSNVAPITSDYVPPVVTSSTPSAASTTPTTASSTPTTTPSSPPSTSPAAFGIKHSDSGTGTGMVLPLLLILSVVLLIGGPGGFLLATSGAAGGIGARLRRGLHR